MKKQLLTLLTITLAFIANAQKPTDDGTIVATFNFDTVTVPTPPSNYFTYSALTSIDFKNSVDISSAAANGTGQGVEFFYDAGLANDEEITLHTFSNVAPGDYIIQYEINAQTASFGFDARISDGTNTREQPVTIYNGNGTFQKRYTAQISISSNSNLSFKMYMSPFATAQVNSSVYIDDIELIKMNAPLVTPIPGSIVEQTENFDAAVSAPASSGLASFTSNVSLSAAADVNGTGQGVQFNYNAFYNEVTASIDLVTFSSVPAGTYWIEYQHNDTNTISFYDFSYYNQISDGTNTTTNYINAPQSVGFSTHRTYEITTTTTGPISLKWIAGETNNNTRGLGGYPNFIDEIKLMKAGCTNTTGTDTKTECDSLTWIDGLTYTSSNNTATYNIVGGAASGCDSLVTLDLTINSATTNTVTDTACGSYTGLDGTTWTMSGTYKDTIGNANGCDSITTYNLSIGNKTYDTVKAPLCLGSFTSTISSKVFTTTGFHNDTIKSVLNCDSIVVFDIFNRTTLVTTKNNSGSGSLREIIQFACPKDTIRFDPSLLASGTDTILLTSEIAFSKPLTIIGLINGTDSLIISGGGTTRIFNVTQGGNLCLDSMVFKNGRGTSSVGGVLLFDEGDSLFIKNSTFNNNNAGINGGAVYFVSKNVASYLEITNSLFDNNESGGVTGAILYESFDEKSTLVVSNSHFLKNSAPSNFISGGIYLKNNDSAAFITIINSVFDSNTGSGLYFDIGESSEISVSNSTFTKNSSGAGGAICLNYPSNNADITMTVDNSVFESNYGDNGGAFYLNAASRSGTSNLSLSITNSILNKNSTGSAGGAGIYSRGIFVTLNIDSTSIINNNAARGGGIYNITFNVSSINITNSTLDNNNGSFLGGGINWNSRDANSTFNIINSTISNCRSFEGAAIRHTGSPLNILNSTLINNISNNNAIYSNDSVTIKGSIIHNPQGTVNIDATDFVSNGYNIFDDSSSTYTYHPTDYNNVDSASLNLDTLKNNGGVTETMAPLAGSIAINSGDPSDVSNAQNIAIVAVRDRGAAEKVCNNTYDTVMTSACSSYTGLSGKTWTMSGTYQDTIQNATTCDSVTTYFLVIDTIVNQTIKDTVCYSYTGLDGTTWTVSGNYIDTLQNTRGCDSLITAYELIIDTIVNQTIKDTVCYSYTGLDGEVWTMSGNYIDTLQNTRGCDSLITAYELIIDTIVNQTIKDTVCYSYTGLDGETWTMSGNYIDTIQNTRGCDSLITAYELIIDTIVNQTIKDTVCYSYTGLDGEVWTVSGNYIDTIQNSRGCDSLITAYELIIDTIVNQTIKDTVCYSYTGLDGETWTISGNYFDTIQNSRGCDSLITSYELIIDTIVNQTIKDTVCYSYTGLDGDVWTMSGTYIDTIQNARGCDSLITSYELIINQATTNMVTTTVCDSYTGLDGTTWTTSGTYMDTILNSKMCDSITTYNLTINHKTINTVTASACYSYTGLDGAIWTTSGTYIDTIQNAKMCDSITTYNLTINNRTTNTVTATECNSYTGLDGKTWTVSGTYVDTILNSKMCDSITTYNLTINYSTTNTVTATVCNSYTGLDGKTWTTSGTYMDTVLNSMMCDSITTYNLTINYYTSNTVTATNCYSYRGLAGKTWNTSGTYIDTIPNASGCDLITTYNLTINQATYGTDTQTACDSYYWTKNGMTYTASTSSPSWTIVGGNSNGCDSIVTLNLTINNSNSGTDVQTACDSYRWINGVTYTASNNTATKVLTNAAGCDSVVTLNLTIKNSSNATDTHTACGSFTWIDGITYTSSTSTPTWIIAGGNSVGCDSTVRLILTINPINSVTVNKFACFSYTVPETGNTYTTSGVYKDSTVNATTGCYNYFITNLTINTVTAGTISVSGGELTVTPTNGDFYRWLDCDNDFARLSFGDSSRTFTPSKNGNYACMVYNHEGCIDTSACFNMMSVGIREAVSVNQLSLFPNPTNSVVNIKLDGYKGEVNLIIYDALGKMVFSQTNIKADNIEQIDIANFKAGVYVVSINNENIKLTKRFVVTQ